LAWPPIPQTLVSTPFPVNFGYTYLQVSNTQGTATPTNFQQYIQLPPQLSLNTWPLRFYADPALTQPLYAWYETPTTVWVLLPNGVPANSSINIYFNVGTPDGVYTGMAPYLSPTYGQYDNGASVFNNYWNFAGTSLPSGWNSAETASLTVNNGVSFTGANSGGNAAQIVYTTAISRPLVIEYYAYSSGTNPTAAVAYVNTYDSAFVSGYMAYFPNFGGNCSTNTEEAVLSFASGSSTSQASNTDCPPTKSYNIWTLSLGQTGGPISAIINYGSTPAPVTWTDSLNYNNYYVALSSWWNDKTIHIQYARVRAYPPNGVQPSVSFV